MNTHRRERMAQAAEQREADYRAALKARKTSRHEVIAIIVCLVVSVAVWAALLYSI